MDDTPLTMVAFPAAGVALLALQDRVAGVREHRHSLRSRPGQARPRDHQHRDHQPRDHQHRDHQHRDHQHRSKDAS